MVLDETRCSGSWLALSFPKEQPMLAVEERKSKQTPRGFMKANVFQSVGRFGLQERPIPRAGYGEAVVQVRLTTICGTDIHIVKGEYPVADGTILGHEAAGVIHELG